MERGIFLPPYPSLHSGSYLSFFSHFQTLLSSSLSPSLLTSADREKRKKKKRGKSETRLSLTPSVVSLQILQMVISPKPAAVAAAALVAPTRAAAAAAFPT